MSALNAKTLQRFVELAGERLSGDWVVIGGCVPHLLGIGTRITLDIDVAGPSDAGAEQALRLMEVAEELGLPIESINQAGAFFLAKIDGWQRHVREFHSGPSARVLIPDATLFLLLKIARLTEADLDDCLRMISWARRRSEPLDVGRTTEAARERATQASAELKQRLQQLLDAVGGA